MFSTTRSSETNDISTEIADLLFVFWCVVYGVPVFCGFVQDKQKRENGKSEEELFDCAASSVTLLVDKSYRPAGPHWPILC